MEIWEVGQEVDKKEWNRLAPHPLQAIEWGEFRKQTGVEVVRYGIFDTRENKTGGFNPPLREPIQITIHPLPYTPWTIGYLPKGFTPSKELVEILREVAKRKKCVLIKIEPKVEANVVTRDTFTRLCEMGFVSGRPLFTKYNFVLDVTPSEEELLAAMKPKTRYNIKVAEKRGVSVEIDNSKEAFERYLELTAETTKRQGFYAHGRGYHEKMWQKLQPTGIANLLVAKYRGEIITTWVLFKLNDTLYYPYGASTREHREVMANNLVMWEAIKLAKKWGLRYLDMWGALGPDADPKNPWFGFHTFKAGYGARQVEYLGTWDFVAKPSVYRVYRLIESLRWKWLRLIKK